MNRDNAEEHPRSTLFVQAPASVPYTQFPPEALLSLGRELAGQWSMAQDPSNCVISSLFPCVTFGQNAEIIDRNPELPEEPCADLLVHWFFPLCAVCQEYRELKKLGIEHSIGWIANVERLMSQDRSMVPQLQYLA